MNGAELQDVNGDLVIRRGADVTYVWGWVDGDYGITFEEKDKPDDDMSDGVSEAAGLKTLASLGITSLSLESSVGSLKSTFVRDGVTYNAQDIFVASNQMDSWYKGKSSEITPLSLTLPQSRGYGDVKSLHYAASSSTALTVGLQALDNLPISGLDTYYAKLEAMVEE